MDIKYRPGLTISFLFMYFSLKSHVSFVAHSISANHSLSGDQTIVSEGGVFELGFFKPGNSSNYYIGMWYHKISEQTIVWVANRDKPISDRYSSVLRFSDGNLVLLNESKLTIWSTNLTSTTNTSTEAVLLDEGNLVLRDWSSKSSMPLWQSFDHPTHTWLPGMKFGRNKRTKVNQLLTAWKNKEDPAPGLFSLELDPAGLDQYLIVRNQSEEYWTSGIWNGINFAMIPEMISHHMFDFNYVSNQNESYFTYSVAGTIISRLIIDSSGQMMQLYWLESNKAWFQFWAQPRQPCEVYAYCGAFGSCNEQSQPFCSCLQGFQPKSEHDWNLQDYSGGCQRKSQLQCENSSLVNGKSDRFMATTIKDLPKHLQFAPVANIKQCETSCLNNCACTAYAYENNQCSIWIGSLLNLQQLAVGDTDGKTIYIKIAAYEFSSPRNDDRKFIDGGVGSAAFVLLLGLVVVAYLRWKKRTFKTTKAMEGSLVAFSYKELQKATKNFSERLGGGGFGSVFKGVLPDSSVIAVTRLGSISQGEKQFRTEVTTIGNINHVNLVRLLGFCSEGTKRLLVYEYMPNGSLNSVLFHEKGSKILDWKTRFRIALGSARGLAYLHEKCRDRIIHCDIKPENILLDAEFGPKVADFGLAKLIGREFSRVLTTIRGTRGYLAPEWISGVAITDKADVYSYGMTLFELVSGRRNSEQFDSENSKFFPTWVASAITEGVNVLNLLDTRLEGNADIEELLRICRVACWCIQDDETQRPSMGEVVQKLEGVLDVTQSPIPRSIQAYSHYQDHIIFFTASSSSSNQSPHSQNNNPSAASS
ncbi:G-type lectin S-receptor-like serine/threonine-protein kinase At2g19130 [Pistacia vera]|uniref:G-type lectin S-receptor-like serine/threonine-protein kinase At2g19130 n=1 Tax=Pistacia vera TaxID=55513 RepID=UPI001263C3D3|nr:G-type lectin S-receptor-like serine/threonine-protein kinase At2g19130 [Pistacia vera]